MRLKMKTSLNLRNQKMEEQYKLIQAWFAYVLRVVKRKTSGIGSEMTSAAKTRLKSLSKDIANHYKVIEEDVQSLIHDNAYELCDVVFKEVEDNTDWEVQNRKNEIESVIATVIMGAVYSTHWTLPKASEQIAARLEEVVTDLVEHGIELNKSPQAIVDELLQVIDPNSIYQKSYEGKNGTVYITRIDGETQRLVRTTVEHIFQEAFVEAAEQLADATGKDVKIRWISALAENTCEVCESLHNQLFDPEDLPLEHPNGQCDFWIEILT